MRTTLTTLFAIVVTLALFLMMRALISGSPEVAEPPPPTEVVDVVPPPEAEETTPPPDEPPITPEDPPPGVETDLVVTIKPNPPRPLPPIRPPTPGGGEGWTLQPVSTAGGDPIPKFVLPPQYPRQRQIDGTEGWVRVGFTIRADGTVADAAVVDASPRRGVFDDAALSSIRHWRFEPKRDDDGQPVPSRAQYTIEFKLDGGA